MAIFTSYWGESLPLYEGATQLLNLSEYYHKSAERLIHPRMCWLIQNSQYYCQKSTVSIRRNTLVKQAESRYEMCKIVTNDYT